MSQLFACVSEDFALLAADRRVEVRNGSQVSALPARKLFSPGDSVLIATSGAAVGITICEKLSVTLAAGNSMDLEEFESYAMPYFQREYHEFTRKGADWFASHPEAPRLSYVLMVGRTDGGGYGLRFYASEKHGEPFRLLPSGKVLTAPRRLGLEGAVMRALTGPGTAGAVKATVLNSLLKIEALDPAVAGPFDLAVLDGNGLKMETAERT